MSERQVPESRDGAREGTDASPGESPRYRALTEALERAARDVANERIARARGDEDADHEAVVLARHDWLTGRNGYEVLGELRERRIVDPPSHAALASHVAALVEERELARTRRSLRALPGRVLVLGEEGLSVQDATAEALANGSAVRHRAVEDALTEQAACMVAPITEALERAAEASRAHRVWTVDDVDRPPSGVDERAKRLLDETDELADEMLEFLRARTHESDRELRTYSALARALRVRTLDDLAAASSRPKRIAEWLRPSGFASTLERRATADARRPGVAVGVALVMPSVDDARLLPGSLRDGVVAELAMLDGVGRALSVLAANPGTPAYRRRPRRGFTGRALGSLLGRAWFDARALARHRTTPAGVLEQARRTAAVGTLFRLRVAAARVLVGRGARADEELRRATRVEWPGAVATLVCLGRDPDTAFDAPRAGIAWHRALRERWDEDFLRHPVATSWFTSMLARASIETPEVFTSELGAEESVAGELRAFFDGRLP